MRNPTSLYCYFICVVHHCASAESLLVGYESLIEHVSALLGGYSEVKVLHVGEALFYKVRVKVVHHADLPPGICRADVLQVCHVFHYIYNNASQGGIIKVGDPEQLDVVRESAVQQLYFVNTVYRRHVVFVL